MWRRAVHRLSRPWLEGICGTHSAPVSSVPAPPPIPGASITAFQALDLWRRHFEERGVAEPDHSSQYIVAHMLGAKTELVELVLADLQGQQDSEPEALLSLSDSFSALVSNPPYLFSEDVTFLEPEILGHVYLEVDPRHPPLIQQWVKNNMDALSYVETRHDITDRPRFCILRRER
ncbi:hypothetical protein CRUP_028284 [Coryphaenoides rupestris]|nr:hypothetical protein CRUP_028284 [Coryphaenoides rupestris]